MSKFIVVVGNPFDGMTPYGSFDDAERAGEFGERMGDTWLLLELQPAYVAMLSMQGTMCPETLLRGDEDTPEKRANIEARVAEGYYADHRDRPVPGSWTDVTNNEAI